MARVIDCDSHVEEIEETWDYLDARYEHRRPLIVTVDEKYVDRVSTQNAYWMIDHKIVPKMSGHNTTITGSPISSKLGRGKSFTPESQTLSNAAARLALASSRLPYGLKVNEAVAMPPMRFKVPGSAKAASQA